jgi:AraC family transcriptional regulator
MNPVSKALWYIENNFAGEITLDQIAGVAGVSRYHVSRAFGEAIGRPITLYVRGRRLTEAAKALASGATDILTVALESGYGSHEAFTRAFREQFGQTPESVRAQRHLENIERNKWLPKSGHQLADAPDFERYDSRFDTRSGSGEVEIWVPLKA